MLFVYLETSSEGKFSSAWDFFLLGMLTDCLNGVSPVNFCRIFLIPDLVVLLFVCSLIWPTSAVSTGHFMHPFNAVLLADARYLVS